MNVYKVTLCLILVSCYPVHLFVANFAATVQENQDRGITSPISFHTFRISVWLCVLLYLYLFLNYCYAYYMQCKIRYGPGWSAKTQKMGYSVCLAPELPYIDCSRQFWPAESHVTNESTNHTLSTAVTHSQISDKEESIRPQMNPCTRVTWVRVHDLMNLALRKRQRRDIIGPRSPLTPLRLTGLLNSTARYNGVMGLALAQRKRRDFIGPRSPLTPVLLTDFGLH
ncbi:uncharacterized protein LOC144647175 [Oculina patagonica]